MRKVYKLPEILAQLLKDNNYSQNRLALELDVTSTAVSKWIKFKSVPELYTVMAIAEMFNVSLEYLVYGEQK